MGHPPDRDVPRTKRINVNTTERERECIDAAVVRHGMSMSHAVRQLPRILDTHQAVTRAIVISLLTEHEQRVIAGPEPALVRWRERWSDPETWQPVAGLDAMVRDFIASLASVDDAKTRIATKVGRFMRHEQIAVVSWALR